LDKFLSLVLSGAVTGAILALVASGMALTYAAAKIFNLGFGAIAFTAAFLYYELNSGLGWSVLWSAVVTFIAAGPLLGWVLSRLIFGRLTHAGEPAKVMATVGVLIALPALCRWVVQIGVGDFHWNIPIGDQIYALPGIGPEPAKIWHLTTSLVINSDQLIVFIVAVVLGLLLWVLMRFSRIGLQMRAAIDREDLASLLGVNTARASSIAWMIGSSLACAAGIVAGPVLNSLDPETFILVVFVASAAVVLGGFTSVPLAFLGGLLLGVVQNLVAGYATFASSISGFQTSVPFLALLLALVFLGRSRQRVAGTIAQETVSLGAFAPKRSVQQQAIRALPLLALTAVVLVMANAYWLGVLVAGLALSIVSMSYVVVTGLGGMISLAQAAFVTMSGLTTGLLMDRYGWPWLAAVIGGILASMLIGAIVAVPALRVGGLALALATLALGFVGDSVLFQWNYLRGSETGWTIPRPRIGGIDLGNDRVYAVVLILVLLFVGWMVRNLGRSSIGRQASALRASEAGAASSGISVNLTKLRLFVVSAGIAGLGGVLLVTAGRAVSFSTYTTTTGLVWLSAVVLWGVRRPMAAVLAGLSGTLLPAFLDSGFTLPGWLGSVSWQGTSSAWLPQILFGLGAIAMANQPEGLLDRRPRRRTRPPTVAERADATSDHRAIARTHIEPVHLDEPVQVGSDRCLELRSVSAGYGDLVVLRGIDLSLPRGTMTALVGANGAGKSTLCKTIAGLVAATSGSIRFEGSDITDLPTHRRSGEILLAPETRGVFPDLTVEDNLALRVRGSAGRRTIYREFPILAERRRVPAGSLSGGEQQLLAMAPLVVEAPKLLVADEPTLGLAPRIVDQILELFERLKQNGTTLFIAEERAKRVLDIADRVVLIELGQVVWSGPRASLDDDQLEAVYLGSSSEVVAVSQRETAEDAAPPDVDGP